MRALLRYRWPGNVRELEHVIERAVIVAEAQQVMVDDLSPVVKSSDRQPSSSTFTIPPHHTLAEIEKLAILQTLERTSWNKRKAAHILGVYRPTLYSKLRKYHLADASHVSGRRGVHKAKAAADAPVAAPDEPSPPR
jgi:DNA-binding NtrC family response regulator